MNITILKQNGCVWSKSSKQVIISRSAVLLLINSPAPAYTLFSKQLQQHIPVQNTMEETMAMVTTVRKDYRPPPAHLSPTQPIHPPHPASVLHKNACFIRMPESLTQSTYRYEQKKQTWCLDITVLIIKMDCLCLGWDIMNNRAVKHFYAAQYTNILCNHHPSLVTD